MAAMKGQTYFFSLRVHAGRDEEPDLIEDEGRGEDGAADEGGLDVEVEAVGGVGEVELEAEVGDGLLDEVVEALVEEVGDGEADGEVDDGPDEAAAQLFEVLHEAHAGEFGAVLHGAAGAVERSVRHAVARRFAENAVRSAMRWTLGRCGCGAVGPTAGMDSIRGPRSSATVSCDGSRGGKAGGRGHDAEVAGGGDGERGGVRVGSAGSVGVGSGGGRVRVLGFVGGNAFESGGDGGGGFHGGDFLLAVGLLGEAQLFFHLHFELVGSAAELADPFAELAREDGQLLRPEEQQREDEDDDTVRQTGHTF